MSYLWLACWFFAHDLPPMGDVLSPRNSGVERALSSRPLAEADSPLFRGFGESDLTPEILVLGHSPTAPTGSSRGRSPVLSVGGFVCSEGRSSQTVAWNIRSAAAAPAGDRSLPLPRFLGLAQLPPEAVHPAMSRQVFGRLHLVSVMPSDQTPSGGFCSVQAGSPRDSKCSVVMGTGYCSVGVDQGTPGEQCSVQKGVAGTPQCSALSSAGAQCSVRSAGTTQQCSLIDSVSGGNGTCSVVSGTAQSQCSVQESSSAQCSIVGTAASGTQRCSVESSEHSLCSVLNEKDGTCSVLTPTDDTEQTGAQKCSVQGTTDVQCSVTNRSNQGGMCSVEGASTENPNNPKRQCSVTDATNNGVLLACSVTGSEEGTGIPPTCSVLSGAGTQAQCSLVSSPGASSGSNFCSVYTQGTFGKCSVASGDARTQCSVFEYTSGKCSTFYEGVAGSAQYCSVLGQQDGICSVNSDQARGSSYCSVNKVEEGGDGNSSASCSIMGGLSSAENQKCSVFGQRGSHTCSVQGRQTTTGRPVNGTCSVLTHEDNLRGRCSVDGTSTDRAGTQRCSVFDPSARFDFLSCSVMTRSGTGGDPFTGRYCSVLSSTDVKGSCSVNNGIPPAGGIPAIPECSVLQQGGGTTVQDGLCSVLGGVSSRVSCSVTVPTTDLRGACSIIDAAVGNQQCSVFVSGGDERGTCSAINATEARCSIVGTGPAAGTNGAFCSVVNTQAGLERKFCSVVEGDAGSSNRCSVLRGTGGPVASGTFCSVDLSTEGSGNGAACSVRGEAQQGNPSRCSVFDPDNGAGRCSVRNGQPQSPGLLNRNCRTP